MQVFGRRCTCVLAETQIDLNYEAHSMNAWRSLKTPESGLSLVVALSLGASTTRNGKMLEYLSEPNNCNPF